MGTVNIQPAIGKEILLWNKRAHRIWIHCCIIYGLVAKPLTSRSLPHLAEIVKLLGVKVGSEPMLPLPLFLSPTRMIMTTKSERGGDTFPNFSSEIVLIPTNARTSIELDREHTQRAGVLWIFYCVRGGLLTMMGAADEALTCLRSWWHYRGSSPALKV